MLSGHPLNVDTFNNNVRRDQSMFAKHSKNLGNFFSGTPRRKHHIILIFTLLFFLLGTGISFSYSLLEHPSGARASTLVILPGHVPSLIRKSQLLGPTDPSTSINIMVGLRLRNEAALRTFVDNMSKVHSVTGRHFLTPAQVTTAFSPLPASQDAVISYMQQMGFTKTVTYKSYAHWF